MFANVDGQACIRTAFGGNIASNGNWTFGYDAENRMLTAFRNNGAVQATYAYDPLGRRTRKSGVGVNRDLDTPSDGVARLN